MLLPLILLAAAASAHAVEIFVGDFATDDCTGPTSREFTIPHLTSPTGSCVPFIGGASLHNEYCDMSSDPPRLKGTYYPGRGCTGSGAQPYSHAADGTCTKMPPSDPVRSRTFRCYDAALTQSCNAGHGGRLGPVPVDATSQSYTALPRGHLNWGQGDCTKTNSRAECQKYCDADASCVAFEFSETSPIVSSRKWPGVLMSSG